LLSAMLRKPFPPPKFFAGPKRDRLTSDYMALAWL
jgi:hypothetical protein